MARRGDIRGSGEPLCPQALPLAGRAAATVAAARRLPRGRARLFGWLLAALGPTLSPVLPAAQAQAQAGADLSSQLATLEAQIRELEQSLPTPTAETAPAVPTAVGGRLTEARALVALHNFPAAAALLRDLVARGPTNPEYGESLDLLAEALWAQGEYREAEQWFTALVEQQPPHPRVQHGLLRLLDIATHLHSEEGATRWLEVLGRIPATAQLPEAAYAVGKFQFMRREYAAAVAALTPIAPSNPYYVRARYLIGAAAVARGELPLATTEFLALTARPLPDSDDDRRVLELSQMALGRIYHELGQSAKAHKAYLHISQKSNLFKDAIYEAAWSAIRAKDYPRAEEALELLLLAYRDAPQASYAAAEAKLLLGNLQLRRGEPDSALAWFERARTELQPLLAKLGDLLGQHGEPAERVRALIEQNLRSFDLGQVSPPPVRPLIAADPEVSGSSPCSASLARPSAP